MPTCGWPGHPRPAAVRPVSRSCGRPDSQSDPNRQSWHCRRRTDRTACPESCGSGPARRTPPNPRSRSQCRPPHRSRLHPGPCRAVRGKVCPAPSERTGPGRPGRRRRPDARTRAHRRAPDRCSGRRGLPSRQARCCRSESGARRWLRGPLTRRRSGSRVARGRPTPVAGRRLLLRAQYRAPRGCWPVPWPRPRR